MSSEVVHVCVLHGKTLSEENMCPAGHLALNYRTAPAPARAPGKDVMPKSHTPNRTSGFNTPRVTTAAPAPIATINVLGPEIPPPPAPILKPQRFGDEAGRIMVLQLKEMKSNGWVIHCRLSGIDPKTKKFKVLQQGITRVFGNEPEIAKREFHEMCQAALKADWRLAARHKVALMELPTAQKKAR